MKRAQAALAAMAPFGAFLGSFAVLQEVVPQTVAGLGAKYLIVVGVSTSTGLVVAVVRLVALRPPPSTSARDGRLTGELVRLATLRMVANAVQTRHVDGSELVGSTHLLNEAQRYVQPVTALSSAYALKALVLASDHLQGEWPRIAAMRRTIWSLSLDGKVWSESTHPRVPRAEVTAIIVGKLLDAGENARRLVPSADAALAMIDEDKDETGAFNTFIVTTLLRNLSRLFPADARLERLASRLIDNPLYVPGRGTVGWCSSLRRRSGTSTQPPIPSTTGARVPPELVASTAEVLLALVVYRNVHRTAKWVDDAIRNAVRFLETAVSTESLDLHIESIVRYANRRRDVQEIGHFTSAWVIRAMLAAGCAPESPAILEACRHLVTTRNADGVWAMSNGHRPVWMAYQGSAALLTLANQWPLPA